MPVTMKVLIPVERSGYTGQRDQWESHVSDHQVERTDDGRIQLTSVQAGSGRPAVTFDLADLLHGLRAVDEAEKA